MKEIKFTGKTDLNGRDIYQGDKVEWNDYEFGMVAYGTVEWVDETVGFVINSDDGLDWTYGVCVVGNIHQSDEQWRMDKS